MSRDLSESDALYMDHLDEDLRLLYLIGRIGKGEKEQEESKCLAWKVGITRAFRTPPMDQWKRRRAIGRQKEAWEWCVIADVRNFAWSRAELPMLCAPYLHDCRMVRYGRFDRKKLQKRMVLGMDSFPRSRSDRSLASSESSGSRGEERKLVRIL